MSIAYMEEYKRPEIELINTPAFPVQSAPTESAADKWRNLNTRIVSLSGYAGSGKDTVAKHLVEKHGYVRLAFADKIREGALKLDPLIPMPAGSHYRLSTLIDIMGWDVAKKEFPEVRRLLQVFGQEIGRELLGKNVWVDKVVEQFRPNQKYVVSDTRYPNEFTRLFTIGAAMVWVSRPGVGPLNAHGSENSLSLDYSDHFIEFVNNGTIEELNIITDEFVATL